MTSTGVTIFGCARLDPADVQGGRSEVHLIPAKVDQLGSP
jgi:hypothetical protein